MTIGKAKSSVSLTEISQKYKNNVNEDVGALVFYTLINYHANSFIVRVDVAFAALVCYKLMTNYLIIYSFCVKTFSC